MHAALKGHLDCVRLLIDYEADLDAIDCVRQKENAQFAFYFGTQNLIVYRPISNSNCTMNSPLMICTHAVYFCICHTQQKQTALIHAARETHIECVRMLVEADADLDAIDGVRDTISSVLPASIFSKCACCIERSP